ncbi:HD-GYP domain-containing protein [Pseudomonas sp. FEN]|uniref:HD-GYP domain-containing protein n=1 Tax=Pseudomonas sp. FEN TaxID=2767468 RepID=UPI00174ADF24|nr:HD-GYP domain-containing protein [Pseudomonas sp. FEN]
MLKRIAVVDVRLGMYLLEFCGAWSDHPFWKERFLLDNNRDLRRLLDSRIREVWIDTSKGRDVDISTAASTVVEVEARADRLLASLAEGHEKPALRSSLAEEAVAAQRLCIRSRAAVIEMFGQVRLGLTVDVETVGQLVDDIAESIGRHPHALISLARLKSADDYTYMHSVAVCALMIALARQLDLSAELVREAGLAGLLHDIGKMMIPQEILNKPGKLTDEEFIEVYKHPENGGLILRDCHQVSALVLDVCMHHHEKFDGSGYPYKLAGEQISLLGRMGAICDVYDAITSDRPYKLAWGPSEAIRKMAEWEGHFDPLIFQAFIKAVGIYPVGSLVRLQSGRLAVVMEQDDASLLTPKVKIFFSTHSNIPIEQQVLNLAGKQSTDRIVGRESNNVWKFKDLTALWLDR